MKEYSFREPLLIEDNGLYITKAQVDFYLNRDKGLDNFRECNQDFLSYYKNCCLYNLVYDMLEEDSSNGKLYWDTGTQSIAVAFPVEGAISKALGELTLSSMDNIDFFDDGQSDSFGIYY